MGSNALNALLGKAFSERSENFSAAQRRESNGILLPVRKEILSRTGCIQYPLTRAFSTWAATLPAAPAPLPPSSTTTAKA